MCYGRMMDMRSDAAQRRTDTDLATKEKAAEKTAKEHHPGSTRDPAYARFMTRLEHWLARASDKDTVS